MDILDNPVFSKVDITGPISLKKEGFSSTIKLALSDNCKPVFASEEDEKLGEREVIGDAEVFGYIQAET